MAEEDKVDEEDAEKIRKLVESYKGNDAGDADDSSVRVGKPISIRVAAQEEMKFTLDGPVRSRRMFTSYFLTAATQNAKTVHEIEEEFRSGNSEDSGRVHDSHVIQSIISSYTAVETNINEFLDRVEEGGMNHFEENEQMVEKVRNLVESYPREFDKLSTGEKYQLVLVATGSDTFDKGGEPWQSMNLLREMRNYFVHHKPEAVELPEDENPNTRLGKMLKTKNFELNPAWEDEEAPFFPHKALSFGCAKWALGSSCDFIVEFYEKLGCELPIPDPHEEFYDEL